MAQVKLTVRRGANTPAAVTIVAGTPEAQTDTVSLNIDYTKISKGDALLMIEQFRQRLFSLPWPPAVGTGGIVLTLTGPMTFTEGAAPGTLVANIGNVPAGVTPTLTPNDGRLVVAGGAGAWTVVTGNIAATAGTIALAVSAAGATGAGASVVVSAAAAPGTFTIYAGALSGADLGAFTGTLGTVRAGDKPVSGDGYTTELLRVSGGRLLVGSDF